MPIILNQGVLTGTKICKAETHKRDTVRQEKLMNLHFSSFGKLNVLKNQEIIYLNILLKVFII